MSEEKIDLKKLAIPQLQDLCNKRGLSTSYRLKDDLLARLGVPIITIDDDDVFQIVTGTARTTNEGNQTNSNETINDNEENSTMATISFKDVEEALPKFSGKPHESFIQWETEYSLTAMTCKWGEIQKYLYARKLMKGEARKHLEDDKGLTTYESLVAYMKSEYKETKCMLDIHSLLTNRTKSNKETCVEYYYDMKAMGNNQLDDESMVRYIVNGIKEGRASKTSLYEAPTLNELKNRLRAYQRILEEEKEIDKRQPKDNKNNNERNNRKSEIKKTSSDSAKKTKCYNCGNEGHINTDCPEKGKGKKCFNCGCFGHISKDCLKPRTEKKGPNDKSQVKSIMMLKSTIEENMLLPIKVNGKMCTALLDTGSPYTVMDLNQYRQFELPKWTNRRVSITGFAGKAQSSLGETQVTVTLQNNDYTLLCQVIPNGLMPYKMVLGTNLLSQANVNIIGGIPEITKATVPMEENNIMLISALDTEQLPSQMDCVTDIQDADLRNEVAKLVDNYTPAKLDSSILRMEILLTDNIPVYQHPRRLSAMERELAQTMIDGFIKEGIARPSNSPYASPILLRMKKNGTWRFCVDYRKLNEKIVKDRYPLPLMESVIDSIRGDLVFSSIDLRNGFYHVDIEPESIKYTAFITPDGHYEFIKAPFGLCNSPAVFQRYINMVFHDAQQAKLVRLYLDDVLIGAQDEYANLEKLKKVVEIASNNGLLIQFSKCKFLQKRIDFLGFIVEGNTVRPSQAKTLAVKNFPNPTTVKAVQSFLGLTGFFRKFIKDYAVIARPLSQLLKKDVPFKFGKEQAAAVDQLKNIMCNSPVLAIYNQHAETELHTDASALGYGGCLLQKQNEDGQLHPVYFLSFKTDKYETNLHSYILETLAVVKCTERLRPYLLGLKFKVYTDCHAFQQTMDKRNATAKIARWALALDEFDMEVKHRSGAQMQHVDALSRYFMLIMTDDLVVRIRKAQEEDDDCQAKKVMVSNGMSNEFIIRSDLLYHFKDGYYRLMVPKAMVPTVLSRVHADTHLSQRRMENILRQDYYIPDMSKKVTKFLQNCVTCILATKTRGKKDGWLQPIEKFDTPLHTYHMDHIGPMASTSKRYAHILVLVDAFTKFIWLYPTKSTKAPEAVEKLKQQQTIFGNPSRIIADKARAFEGHELKTYCDEQDIYLHLVTTATPRGNGQAERMNSSIKQILTKLSIDNPKNWYKFVPRLQRAMNDMVTCSTGFTPFRLLMGVDMKNKETLDLTKVIETELTKSFDVDRSEQRKEAAQNIQKLQQQNAKQYNKKRKEPHLYTLGDLVAIERVQKEKGSKFFTQMIGPYEVIKVKRNNRYDVHKVGHGDGPVNTSAPADRMKPWADEDNSSDE